MYMGQGDAAVVMGAPVGRTAMIYRIKLAERSAEDRANALLMWCG